MKITVIGTGYVGLVSGACLADMGNDVICVDTNADKVEKLKKGIMPIFEPGLETIVHVNVAEGRLVFTTDFTSTVNQSEVVFLAVGTPPGKNHEADLSQVEQAARAIGRAMDRYQVIVTKSTVPVGTGAMIRRIIEDEQAKRNISIEFDVASNPEFLREGNAVKDFMNPDRVVIGLERPEARARELMMRIYRAVAHMERPLVLTDIRSAELIKYASNCFLATKISFINEIANFCELVGADVEAVAKGMGLDTRIGARFLHAGIGYGGSCFPKDVQALIQTGKKHGYEFQVIQAAEEVNQTQRLRVIEKLVKAVPDLTGKTLAVWGLSFKANTDDMREAPSVTILPQLLELYPDLAIRAYDPAASHEARHMLPDSVTYVESSYDALQDADALLVLTEWDEFRLPDFERMKKLMKQPIVIDGRNLYDPRDMEQLGFTYSGIGR